MSQNKRQGAKNLKGLFAPLSGSIEGLTFTKNGVIRVKKKNKAKT